MSDEFKDYMVDISVDQYKKYLAQYYANDPVEIFSSKNITWINSTTGFVKPSLIDRYRSLDVFYIESELTGVKILFKSTQFGEDFESECGKYIIRING